MPELSGRTPRAEFGVSTASFVVVSSMVGVGVLTTSGRMVLSLESNTLMLLVWVAGGIIALCGALSLAEVASAWPGSGGDYVILYEAYGALPAFLAGWATLVVGFAAPIAAASSAAALYVLAPFSLSDEVAYFARQGVASLAIVGFAWIHASGYRRAMTAQGLVTILEIVLLAAFVVAGVALGWPGRKSLQDLPVITVDRLSRMAFALVYVAYSYTGWNAAAYLAGEVALPGKTLPKAIVFGTAGVVLLYLGINVVYALALPASEIVSRAALQGPDSVVPIAELAAIRLFGEGIATPLSIAVGLILLATVSAYLLTGPRVMFAMVRAGQLPEAAGRLSVRSGTPARATAWLALGSLVFLWSGSFDQVVVYAGVGLAFTSMLTIASVYVLRIKRPDHPRPFRVPGYPVVPAIYLAGSAALVVGVTREEPLATVSAILSILAGWPIYRLTVGRRSAVP